jgi:hypothetical protein
MTPLFTGDARATTRRGAVRLRKRNAVSLWRHSSTTPNHDERDTNDYRVFLFMEREVPVSGTFS